MIVTSTPTICDGTVVRWYRSEQAAIDGNAQVTASRNGVSVPGVVDVQWKPAVDAAWDIHRKLRRDRDADVSDVITHRMPFLRRRELIPVDRST